MRKKSIREDREQTSQVMDKVAGGAEVAVAHHGKADTHIIDIAPNSIIFPDRGSLRGALPPMMKSASDWIHELRGEKH